VKEDLRMVTETLPQVAKTNGITKPYDPFAVFETLEHEMEAMLHRPLLFGFGPWPTMFRMPKETGLTFAPPTDVYEKGDVLVFKVEMPGVAKEDVSIELYDGDLVIKGQATAEKEVKESAYYRMERTYGKFYRRLPLPFEVKPEQITAALTDGVLEIQIPKPPVTKPAATTIPVA
jgi:HSP20 family protein